MMHGGDLHRAGNFAVAREDWIAPSVALSIRDKAPQLGLTIDCLQLIGSQGGYRMVRATHGVHSVRIEQRRDLINVQSLYSLTYLVDLVLAIYIYIYIYISAAWVSELGSVFLGV